MITSPVVNPSLPFGSGEVAGSVTSREGTRHRLIELTLETITGTRNVT